MNKSELVKAISAKSGESQVAVECVLDSLETIVTQHVILGEKAAIPGFVSFEQVTRSARTGRNPKTGESIQIPERKGVKASVGGRLKKALKQA